MFDIIITISDKYEKITQTLSSIAIQTRKENVCVYLVVNKNKYNCKKELDLFKDSMDIKELNIEYENNLGLARNYAINNSNNKYIIFLNSGDQLYNCYTLVNAYDEIQKNSSADIFFGKNYTNSESIYSRYYVDNSFYYSNLDGKIFSRDFLVNNNILFNNSILWEDDSFYHLAINIAKSMEQINCIVSSNLQKKRETVEREKYLMVFLYNRLWTERELKKRNVQREKIFDFMVDSFLYVFAEIYEQMDNPNYEVIFQKCWNFEKHFSEYNDLLTLPTIENKIQKFFSTTSYYTKYLTGLFEKFRNKFRKNGE